MSESVASVRETSSSKNNNSGNIKSNNGSLYFTTTTTTYQNVQDTTILSTTTTGQTTIYGNIDDAFNTRKTAKATARLHAKSIPFGDDSPYAGMRAYSGSLSFAVVANTMTGQNTGSKNLIDAESTNSWGPITKVELLAEAGTVTGTLKVYGSDKIYGSTSSPTSFA